MTDFRSDLPAVSRVGRGRRYPVAGVLTFACILGSVAFVGPGHAGPAEWRHEERLGDAAARKAYDGFDRAAASWRQVAVLAQRIGDRTSQRRASDRRLALCMNRLDPGGFIQLLGRRTTDVTALPSALRAGAAVDLRQLGKLASLLRAAKTEYAARPDSEVRDLLLIHEALAVVERAVAEVHQQRADASYERALAALGNSADGAEAELAAAVVRLHWKERRFDKAWEIASRARADFDGLPRKKRIAHLRVLQGIATFRRARGDLLAIKQSLMTLGETAAQGKRSTAGIRSFIVGPRLDLAAVVTACVHLGESYELESRPAAVCAWVASVAAIELGEHALAEEFLRSHTALPTEEAWLRAAVLTRLGLARDRLGDFEGALVAFADARDALESVRDAATFRARVELSRARALLGLGRPIAAGAAARTVFGDRAAPLDVRLRARSIVATSLWERSREDPSLRADALRAFRAIESTLRSPQAAELVDRDRLEVENSIHLANLLRDEAIAHESASGDLAAAKKLRADARARQDVALRWATQKKDWALAAIAASNIGELDLESGDADGAAKFVDWALARAREERQFETEWRCHWYLGRIAQARGADVDVDGHFAEAARIIDSYRSAFLSAEAKSGFLSDKLDLYRDMLRRELARGRPDRALEIAERGRARALVETLGWRYVALSTPRDTALYRRYVTLTSQAAAARSAAKRHVLGVETRVRGYDALRDLVREAKEAILAEPRNGALRALLDGAPASAAEIVALLGPHTTLIEYYFLGDAIVAFVVQNGRTEAVALPMARTEIWQLAREFRTGSAGDDATARKLHAALVAPLEARVAKDRVLIVPHGVLQNVPFETLIGADGRRQIEKWTIAYLPSASLLRYVRANDPAAAAAGSTLRLLAFADPSTDYNRDGKPDRDPLAYARVEVEGFAQRFGQRQVLSGAAARESVLADAVAGPDVIHFACHGEFNPQSPWRSALFLAPEGAAAGSNLPTSADGQLLACEVYALDLRRKRLVTLSGCETGRSVVATAEEPVGIGTSFFHCGVASMLVSLWRVEDAATAELMKSFYRKWLDDGMDCAAALRAAKLEMMRGSFGHPRQWAAFVFLGDH